MVAMFVLPEVCWGNRCMLMETWLCIPCNVDCFVFWKFCHTYLSDPAEAIVLSKSLDGLQTWNFWGYSFRKHPMFLLL